MVGAIDGSHIALKTVPVKDRIEYFNRKQDYSVVVQAVADASFKFLDVTLVVFMTHEFFVQAS